MLVEAERARRVLVYVAGNDAPRHFAAGPDDERWRGLLAVVRGPHIARAIDRGALELKDGWIGQLASASLHGAYGYVRTPAGVEAAAVDGYEEVAAIWIGDGF